MASGVVVQFDWRDAGEIGVTPDGLALLWPSMPEGGGVYRLVLRLDGRTRFYVGETDN